MSSFGGVTPASALAKGGNKKAKIESNNSSNHSSSSDPFDTVRQYLLSCPHVASDHPAIKAALTGLEQEQKRRERDAKLQAKFGGGCNNNTTARAVATATENSVMRDAVTVERPKPSATTTTSASSPQGKDDMDQDWHDLAHDDEGEDVGEKGAPSSQAMDATADEVSHPHNAQDSNMPASSSSSTSVTSDTNSSYLGKRLARQAVASLAQHRVRVQTPLAALAVVLHATLRLPALGLDCTGVPEEDNKKSGAAGFAAPVRSLPAHVLLPPGWDKPSNADPVQFRYRKAGLGAVVLRVATLPNPNSGQTELFRVQVTVHPTRLTEPPSDTLEFTLEEHLNLESFRTAASKTKWVEPALHYKALAGLLTAFVKTFDLGTLHDEHLAESEDQAAADAAKDGVSKSNKEHPTSLPYVDTSIVMQPGMTTGPTRVLTTGIPVGGDRHHFTGQPPAHAPSPYVYPPTMPHPHGPRYSPGGDFARDLLPGGGAIGGGLVVGGGSNGMPPFGGGGGMFMGPDHPMFTGNGGGGGLDPNQPFPPGWPQPRHDRFGPPGGPTHPLGEPNPDHLQMPGGLGSAPDLHSQPPNFGARTLRGNGRNSNNDRPSSSSLGDNMFM